LQRIPGRNYDRNQILTFYEPGLRDQIERFAQLPELQRAGYKFIKGHLYFGFHQFVPGESTYVTFLREPISRVLSFYSYARSHPDHYLYRLITEERLGLEAFLKREATVELFNLQTRMIAGDANNPNGSVDRSMLERAKENLRTHFCSVGLTEEFDASLLLLARTIGWRLPLFVKRNVSSKKSLPCSIDAQTAALLREANALDLELYEFAQELLQSQLRAAGDWFESELRRFQGLNFMAARCYEHYESLVHGIRRMAGRPARSASMAPLSKTSGDSAL
jgi:Galactose-3-O-sulfotransferase